MGAADSRSLFSKEKKMNYDEFLDIAVKTAEKMFPYTEVSIRQVDKLQGESYKGLNVRIKDSNTG